jgi:molybdopterin molybdotransferase
MRHTLSRLSASRAAPGDTPPVPDLLLDQLRRRAYDETGPLPPVDLRPGDAVGHFLREDLHALLDLPPTEIATVSGWAVAGPGPWQLLSTQDAAAIAGTAGVLPDGYAAEVRENGALPQGATAVVSGRTGLVQDGRLFGEALLGDHVLPRAAECAADALLVPEGTLLTPGAAALAAAGGHPDVRVTGRPTVALLLAYGEHGGTGLPNSVDVTGALLTGLLRSTDAADVAARRVPDTRSTPSAPTWSWSRATCATSAHGPSTRCSPTPAPTWRSTAAATPSG